MLGEFIPFPKIPRLFRDMVITEKIDGTNAAIVIDEASYMIGDAEVYAQSRKRVITPDDDNFGFARWVEDSRAELISILGPGTHFGEWWGSGIQRGYGLTKGEKRFSLFNVARWGFLANEGFPNPVPGLGVVPTLFEGPFTTTAVDMTVQALREIGSYASPGFMNPEGIIVWHDAARQMFKVTCKDDEKPKGQQ